MKHAIKWFELPVDDLRRAKEFYETVLGSRLGEETDVGDRRYRMIPGDEGGVAGAIVEGDAYTPSRDGALLFLDAGDELAAAVGRVETAGGRVLTPRFEMGDWGVAAFIVDSEGNRIALHASA
jgi:predicted enzyme related to lactoylglutathione lyase